MLLETIEVVSAAETARVLCALIHCTPKTVPFGEKEGRRRRGGEPGNNWCDGEDHTRGELWNETWLWTLGRQLRLGGLDDVRLHQKRKMFYF